MLGAATGAALSGLVALLWLAALSGLALFSPGGVVRARCGFFGGGAGFLAGLVVEQIEEQGGLVRRLAGWRLWWQVAECDDVFVRRGDRAGEGDQLFFIATERFTAVLSGVAISNGRQRFNIIAGIVENAVADDYFISSGAISSSAVSSGLISCSASVRL